MFSENTVATAFTHLSLLAQEGDAPPPASAIGQLLENPLTFMVGLFFIFYFVFIRPETRRKREEANMMAALMKNDRVITIGGIHGTIVSAPQESKVVTIRIEDNTRMKINRSAIAQVVSDKESSEEKNKETTSSTNDK